MRYYFSSYSSGQHSLRIGNHTLEICDGVADVNELDPAQVALAEVYGGKPASIGEVIQPEQPASIKPNALLSFVTIVSKKGRALTSVFRTLTP